MNPYVTYLTGFAALVAALAAAAWMLDVPLAVVGGGAFVALGVAGWAATNRARRAVPPPRRDDEEGDGRR